MEQQKILYVVFLHDPQSVNYEKGAAMDKNMYACFGYQVLFEKDSCFESPKEAEQYINTLLEKREMISGALRPDITKEHFSIHPVFQSKMLPTAYWLDEEYML